MKHIPEAPLRCSMDPALLRLSKSPLYWSRQPITPPFLLKWSERRERKNGKRLRVCCSSFLTSTWLHLCRQAGRGVSLGTWLVVDALLSPKSTNCTPLAVCISWGTRRGNAHLQMCSSASAARFVFSSPRRTLVCLSPACSVEWYFRSRSSCLQLPPHAVPSSVPSLTLAVFFSVNHTHEVDFLFVLLFLS